MSIAALGKCRDGPKDALRVPWTQFLSSNDPRHRRVGAHTEIVQFQVVFYMNSGHRMHYAELLCRVALRLVLASSL